MPKPLSCFILAAGFGERMRPITNHTPKPFLPIAGTPLIEKIISKMLHCGIEKIGVNSHHLHEHIADWAMSSELGRRVTLFHETEILDTGGALKNAESFLEGSDILVHNGDIVSDIDLHLLINRHKESGHIATLAIHDFTRFNNLTLSADGSLKDILNSSCERDEKTCAFTGIAVYSPEFLKFLPTGKSGLVDAWKKALKAGHKIGTIDVTGRYWNDIGTPAAYVSAVMHDLRAQGESLYIARSAEISENLEIDSHVIIERDCITGDGASLRNVVMLPLAEAVEGSIHKNCIMGPGYKVPIEESAFSELVEGKGILIGVGGSDRKYYRIADHDTPVVLMECRKDDADYSRHIEYTRFFRKFSIPVPELISADEALAAALFEDLGDISLYSWLKLRRPDHRIEAVYQRVLDILAMLHCEASDHVTECPTLANRIFDYDHLRWETDYFIERFVKGLKDITIGDIDALKDELHHLALKTDAFTKRIIHRDFQSQNIMITKGDLPRVIDFQGARMAPPAYDLASILWDPYAPLENEMRQRLLGYYSQKVSEKSAAWFSETELKDSLICCRLQRHMQALGAYGFLSTEKNKPYFLKHVPEALRLLKEDIIPVSEEFPALRNLINLLS